MASLKFRHYATENELKGTGTIQAALNTFDVGTIVFIDDTQKQYIITSKTNNVVTYKIYYGKPAVVSVSGSGAALTLTWSDSSEETVTINDVAHATLADVSNTTKSVAWGNVTEKPNIVTTDTEQTISGAKIFNNNTTFHNETDMESLTTDSLLVTGSARFTNTINGNLKGNVEGNLAGNASSATKATNDGSGNTITTTYATKTERSNNDITAASLTASKLTLTRATGNITANIPTWNQDTTGTAAKATADANGNNIANTYATKAEVAALPKSMVIKGTLDASHALPTSEMTEGDTYIVGASGTYNKIACKVGDFFVRTSDSWLRIPAGDEWEYNENTIKAIKVDNARHADTAGTATNAGIATNLDTKPSGIFTAATASTDAYLTIKAGNKISDAITIGKVKSAFTADTATTASSCTGNSATATKAGYLDTGTMTLYAHNSNEINFGGTSKSDIIYFGYRATESRPIPTSFIFGGSTGTATLTANGFKKKDSDASYVLTGDGGHTKISGLSVNYAASSGACTGNAATATKLETARTLWGQRFDGSGNISGNISSTGNITPSVTKTSDLGSNALSYRYLYTTWVGAPGNTKLTLGASNATHLTIDTNGNVGIGTPSPTSKLHVAGAGYFTGDTSSAANIIAGGYIKGETVKISSGCTLEYDSTQKCVKFVFS